MLVVTKKNTTHIIKGALSDAFKVAHASCHGFPENCCLTRDRGCKSQCFFNVFFGLSKKILPHSCWNVTSHRTSYGVDSFDLPRSLPRSWFSTHKEVKIRSILKNDKYFWIIWHFLLETKIHSQSNHCQILYWQIWFPQTPHSQVCLLRLQFLSHKIRKIYFFI